MSEADALHFAIQALQEIEKLKDETLESGSDMWDHGYLEGQWMCAMMAKDALEQIEKLRTQ